MVKHSARSWLSSNNHSFERMKKGASAPFFVLN
jgi:hypothetical protein